MSVVTYQDLPLAARNREWDRDEADKRVRKWAGAQEEPNQKYRKAFVWYDQDEAYNYKAYKFQIADVVGGSLKAVPHAVFNAAAVLQGARGGADIPAKEVDRVKSHLARYYKKLGDTPPWADG